MFYRIEVAQKEGFFDAAGEAIKKDVADLGFRNRIKSVRTIQVYLLEGDLKEFEIKKICEDLLIDPVTQDYGYDGHAFNPSTKASLDIVRDGLSSPSTRAQDSTLSYIEGSSDGEPVEPQGQSRASDTSTGSVSARRGINEDGYRVIEIAYNAGVMDPVEESARKAISDLGIRGVRSVKTAKKYLIRGNLSYREIQSIAQKTLYNKVIQHAVKDPSAIHSEGHSYKFRLKHVDMVRASDRKLSKISKDGQLFLNIEEMRAIKRYFRKLGRNPTDCELETLAQTWSEHCKHKTFRGIIEYEEEYRVQSTEYREKRKKIKTKKKTVIIDDLLKSTIMKVTEELKKPWCVSVFHDNSGIIRFDEKHNICFKVETHNHPSALEPYGGAGTGLGGVIRDPLGTGLGAKPIINTDVFCFGRPDYPYSKLPKGALHPKRVMKGVVAGVRDYGNRMGIPTSNGAVLFDDNFVGNPLVFCGNVGIMPKDKSFKKVNKGDLVVVVGGRTGRDGIHGATFSSGELTHESEEVSGSAVQIGNPIQEKKMADTILQARDARLYNAITDCGAGGLSSAVGEMGEKLGAEVMLEKVPLKYKGLRYDEIWISEAQERMVLAVSPRNIDALKEVFERENVEATVIGRFTGTGRLKLSYEGNTVCDMDMKFIHNGVPNLKRKAVWNQPRFIEPRSNPKKDLTGDLINLLSNLNIASKEWIIRQYDHEVQGGGVIKPLQGVNSGPGDACITRPVLGSKKGIILSCGINPDFGKIDPYWMAAGAIDEALRQVVSVGGDISRCAILDNFCWGNTNKPDRLGGLVRAARACYDIAKIYGVPFISGKDSLNNEYSAGGKTISIPPTLLISAIAVMDDISKSVTMDAKKGGSAIYLVGLTYDELGGSQYYKMTGYVGKKVPRVNPACGRRVMAALSGAIRKGYVRSCHDCSEGGMAVALAEMAFAGALGMEIRLGKYPAPTGQERLGNEALLFSESNTRFIVETGGRAFRIFDAEGRPIVRSDIDKLKAAWQKPFRDF
jgi:phosphoribosylformylglycinamidine synthase II